MLTALIRKDFRICRLPILAGLFLFVGPFVMSAVIVCNMPLWSEATSATAWAALLGTGCYFSIMCSQATLAMLSGNIVAVERGDRSAEFLASLPPSRWMVVVSKLVVLAAAVLVVWGFNLGVAALATYLAGTTDAAHALTSELAPLRYLAAISVLAMGAGWCGSTIAGSTGPAVTLAFAAPLVVLAGVTSIQFLTNWPSPLDFARVYFPSCVIGGVLLFAVGTRYFLSRMEP